MNEEVSGLRSDNKGKRPSPFPRSARLIPLLIIIASLLSGLIVFLIQTRASAQFKDRVREENLLRLHSTLDHVEDYFDAVYSTLLLVSLDDNVKATRKGSEDFIQQLYDHQWQKSRLSELYVIERDFTGSGRPFATFEHLSHTHEVDQVHSAAREAEEYQVQMSQIRRFLTDTNLSGLISSEIFLCVDGPGGERSRGLVYSVPVHGSNGLAGIISGMIPTWILQGVLSKDQFQNAAFLLNDRGEYYDGRNADSRIAESFKEHFAQRDISSLLSNSPNNFRLGRWIALWAPVNVVSSEKWWALYLYDEDRYLPRSSFLGKLGRTVIPGALVLIGIAMAVAVASSGRRLEEQLRHLSQREQLERQVQEVSEREQRRIGEDLHEDLCQRLIGLEAAGKTLEKRLKSNGRGEHSLATEIVGELHETVSRAQQMADELQPVSLLKEGFIAAIERLAERAYNRFGIRCRVERNEFPPLEDPALATQLYRIIQEGVTNAIQHANATEIGIALAVEGEQLRVWVKDNGKGISENTGKDSGMGLRIMRYRTERINGSLEINAAPGGGTVVICRCPTPPASQPHELSQE